MISAIESLSLNDVLTKNNADMNDIEKENVSIESLNQEVNKEKLNEVNHESLVHASANLKSGCNPESETKNDSEVISINSNTKNKLSLIHSQSGSPERGTNAAPLFEKPDICPADCICQGGRLLFNKKRSTCAEIKWEELKNVQYMTQGAMCRIFSAEYQDQKVIVKTPRLDAEDPAVAAHDLEVELDVLWSLDHKYVIKLLGAGLRPIKPKRFIVLEFLEMGTLAERLNVGILPNQPESGYNKLMKGTKKYQRFHFVTMLERANELAEALEYLHTKVCDGNAFVVHRDLKPDNIGFKADGTLKLFDFGLARSVQRRSRVNARYDMTGETGSMRYMAPEVVGSLPYNEKVDVYAFGLLLWEMLQYRRVFEGMTIGDFYQGVVNGGVRPQLDPTWPPELKSLVDRCWHADIDRRPDFAFISSQLKEIYIQEKQNAGKIALSAINVLEEKRGSSTLKIISPIHRNNRSQTSTFLVRGTSDITKESKSMFASISKKESDSPKTKESTKGDKGGGLMGRLGKFLGRKKPQQSLPTHHESSSPTTSSHRKK